jgi:hypothetical protein
MHFHGKIDVFHIKMVGKSIEKHKFTQKTSNSKQK